MIVTLTKLAKITGVSYTTLQIFADRYGLLEGKGVQRVDFNKHFCNKFFKFVTNRKCASTPMLRLGGLL